MKKYVVVKATWDDRGATFEDQLYPGFVDKIYDTHALAEKGMGEAIESTMKTNDYLPEKEFVRSWNPEHIGGMLCGGALTITNISNGQRIFVEKYWIKPIEIESTIQAQPLRMKGDDI